MADYAPSQKHERTRSHRSRSPRQGRSHGHRERSPHRHQKRNRSPPKAPVSLPFGSRELTKRDYKVFEPMFALYLDIQKGKVLEEMDEVEAKGRWKSFLGKW
jgi:hypothetical protein